MALTWPFKDPQDVLDYSINFSGRIGNDDPISTSTWTIPSGITKLSGNFSGPLSTIWLSGGTLGDTLTFLNHIVTIGGRECDQTVNLQIKSK
jgi:hypothetical protein